MKDGRYQRKDRLNLLKHPLQITLLRWNDYIKRCIYGVQCSKQEEPNEFTNYNSKESARHLFSARPMFSITLVFIRSHMNDSWPFLSGQKQRKRIYLSPL